MVFDEVDKRSKVSRKRPRCIYVDLLAIMESPTLALKYLQVLNKIEEGIRRNQESEVSLIIGCIFQPDLGDKVKQKLTSDLFNKLFSSQDIDRVLTLVQEYIQITICCNDDKFQSQLLSLHILMNQYPTLPNAASVSLITNTFEVHLCLIALVMTLMGNVLREKDFSNIEHYWILENLTYLCSILNDSLQSLLRFYTENITVIDNNLYTSFKIYICDTTGTIVIRYIPQ